MRDFDTWLNALVAADRALGQELHTLGETRSPVFRRDRALAGPEHASDLNAARTIGSCANWRKSVFAKSAVATASGASAASTSSDRYARSAGIYLARRSVAPALSRQWSLLTNLTSPSSRRW